MSTKLNPITAQIIRNRLTAILRESSLRLARAAYSSVIYEAHDFANALFDGSGALIAQAEGLPIFLGATPEPLRRLLRKFPSSEIKPGDIFLTNDPYLGGGIQINDGILLMPYFHGGEAVLFFVTIAHWTDIGGKSPGSWSPDATDIYQEGLRIPPLKLYREGQPNRDLEEMILANVRMGESVLGDLRAQLAACLTARTRLDELLAKYDWFTVKQCIDESLDETERTVRERLREIPDGTYVGVDHVDSDGVVEEPVRIEVEVRVHGDEITFDFSRCPAQSQGPCGNSAYARTFSAVRMAVKCLTAPDLVTNEGFFRPIKVVLPEGTNVNPRPPAPMTMGTLVARAIREAVFKALAPVVPDRVIAGQYGSAQTLIISGKDPRRDSRPFVMVNAGFGGWGARHRKDGISSYVMLEGGSLRNTPVEVIETQFPVTVEQRLLRQDSGGAGQERGGLGVQTDIRILGEDVKFATGMDRYRFAPHGLEGGEPGALSNCLIVSVDGQSRPGNKSTGVRLPRGSMLSHRSGGGGGFGDPLDRDPERVRQDVLNDYVSADAARERYGVVLDASGNVDARGTRARRQQLRRGRPESQDSGR
jgi:N-methylhydantoinase B